MNPILAIVVLLALAQIALVVMLLREHALTSKLRGVSRIRRSTLRSGAGRIDRATDQVLSAAEADR